ncbi:Kinase family protein [Quillaja saponaria]|uniref:Kinase family protein n=1 Tax=Quillaja saponaria TaxID=32244 RepID=A0AAD7L4W9_QUISA|nr:Kinase family protein [Quillaja saponaria]
MDFGDSNQPRLIGDYILGPRIGSGSFAVVWRSTHRHSGLVVAVKEIDKKQLSQKVSENLLKEISILSTINHPNIIRLFEAIETKDRIYLVLEYCNGGDLANYIHRHGKVSETIARHFMRQLAAGLQVLQEKHLIHRDLKPQNLLLASTEATPLLKIGDFGFARSLMPQGLADTLCGSPLYMAPEIILNQKYDAKADLWSVGAILFQLVSGRPPFNGNSQVQLFQNILTATELRFPQGVLEELNPDCLDLCRGLLRQNPVERLTFKEFFGHKFLEESRSLVDVEQSSPQQFDFSSIDKSSRLHSGYPLESSVKAPTPTNSSVHESTLLQRKDGQSTSGTKSIHGITSNIAIDWPRKSVDGYSLPSNQPQVSDSMESIEKDYVLVNAHFNSVETFSYDFEASVQNNSTSRVSFYPPKRNDLEIAVPVQAKELVPCSSDGAENSRSHEPDATASSRPSTVIREVQAISLSHPTNKIQLLHQYVQILTELSQDKYNGGLYLESFAIELVVLAIWKKALEIINSCLVSTSKSELLGSNSANESVLVLGGAGSSESTEEKIDFSKASSVSLWAEKRFFAAFDRAEKLSFHIQNMDGSAEMPDAMEIIFQKALSFGTSGAVDEYMGNRDTAAASYSKAMLLLSFIVGEAVSLSLNPPFLLTPENKNRIMQYILNLQAHHTQSLMSEPSSKASPH